MMASIYRTDYICANVSLPSLLVKKSSCRHAVSSISEISTLGDLIDVFSVTLVQEKRTMNSPFQVKINGERGCWLFCG